MSSPASSSSHPLSVSLDLFICGWILPGILRVYSLFRSLLLFRFQAAGWIYAPHLFLTSTSPSSSSLRALHPEPVLTQDGHIGTVYLLLSCLLLSHPRPGPFLPNCGLGAPGLGCALSSSCSSSRSEGSACPAAESSPQCEKCCSSANVRQDPSPGLNIQINPPALPNSSLFFMVSLLFCMNNRCLSGCWILQRRRFFFPLFSLIKPSSGSAFGVLLHIFTSPFPFTP